MSNFDVTDTYAPCPRCTCTYAKRVNKLLFIGPIGDALFHPVQCINCGKGYNGKTGRANSLAIFGFGILMLVLGVIFWMFINDVQL